MKKLVVIGAMVLASTASLKAQTAEETAAWEIAQTATTSEEVFAFIEQFPDGTYAKDAKARMIDLLWLELATAQPADGAAAAEAPTEGVEPAPVAFSVPLVEGSPEIIGKSLEELIAASPLFPPVEGLPDEYWKEQECSDCHAWEQANLCDQANTYLNDAGAENLVKPHPYGGAFKLTLRNWAMDGCE
ncbi:outer membrane protein assembly factor BamD [Loktanella sp. F6476L]|uniref:outer membrane protein assembly factor BamD n=1 Tax=Loktanella sp. F6476L TaxID=2926405 RepID=UPI001FF271CE|nr:outer membrane protein assembly factor BamD [Loktanella sp. F6476L]MCK0122367.1 outer membrane protein assembly factor BamD [Loktanella sp. F6476L]